MASSFLESGESSAEYLDVLGIIQSTDKASLVGEHMLCSWDFLRHYDALFNSFRDKSINLLEIGVLFGHSIAVWLEYFSKAQIVGLDINPECISLARERVEIRIGSQDDPQFLKSIAAEFPPTIVIDDGSHLAAHMITSFEALFPTLAPGGLYVMEDMLYQFDYDTTRVWPHEPKPPHPQSEAVWTYLSRLCMARLANVSNLQDVSDATNKIYKEIDEIKFVGSMAVIRKRACRDVSKTVAAFERRIDELRQVRANASSSASVRGVDVDSDELVMLSTASLSYALVRFAHYLATYDRKDSRALEVVDEGILLSRDWLYGTRVKWLVLRNLGRLEAAAEMESSFGEHRDSFELPPVAKPPHMAYPHM